MKPFVSIVLSAVLLAAGEPAFAQDQPSVQHREWETSAFAGSSFAPDFRFSTPVLEAGTETSRTVGLSYASSYQVGARLTQYLRDHWAADLEYGFANQPVRFTNLTPNLQSLTLSHFIHSFSYNVSYHFFPRARRLRPYASIGSGALLFFLPGSSKDRALDRGVTLRDSWKFAVNWGGGVTFLLRDQVALRFEALDRMSGVPSYGLPAEAHVTNGQYQPGMSRSGWPHTWQINLGFAFQWDE